MTTDYRARRIARAREGREFTPAEWDRDCRACMSPSNNTVGSRLFEHRAVNGAGHAVIRIADEEIHAWHSDAEIGRFLDDEGARA